MEDPKYGVDNNTPEYIKCLDLLGTLDNALGKYDLAEQKLTEALRLREQRDDVHVVELAHNYSNVASIVSNSGRNEEALQYIEKAIKYLHSALHVLSLAFFLLLADQAQISQNVVIIKVTMFQATLKNNLLKQNKRTKKIHVKLKSMNQLRIRSSQTTVMKLQLLSFSLQIIQML